MTNRPSEEMLVIRPVGPVLCSVSSEFSFSATYELMSAALLAVTLACYYSERVSFWSDSLLSTVRVKL